MEDDLKMRTCVVGICCLQFVQTEEAKVKISDVSGDRVDNKAMLETIKQEESIIQAEKEEQLKEKEKKKAKEQEEERKRKEVRVVCV